MTPRLIPALILTLAALSAQAQVYKWVDTKGQVNYSNAPPPSIAGTAQAVEEQISIMGMDPVVRAWAEKRFAAQERQEEIEHQQRQRSTYVQPASISPSSGYSSDYYPPSTYYGGYYGGYYYGRNDRRPHLSRPGGIWSPPRVTHHSPSTVFRGSRAIRR